MQLQVNTAEVVGLTNALEKVHRSAFPNAVRGTLNKAAFDVKQNTMPESAARSFTQREKNFFKANSKVWKAEGWNVSVMQSEAGMVALRLSGGNNRSVENLEKQERGGEIGGRSMIPIDSARASGSRSKKVKINYRLANIKNAVNANNVNAPTEKQRFIRAAFMAKKLYGSNAFVLGNMRNGRVTLSQIHDIKRGTNKVQMRRTALYSYRKGYKFNVSRTDFMKRAGEETGLNLSRWYMDEAKRQFKRLNMHLQ